MAKFAQINHQRCREALTWPSKMDSPRTRLVFLHEYLKGRAHLKRWRNAGRGKCRARVEDKEIETGGTSQKVVGALDIVDVIWSVALVFEYPALHHAG